MHCLQIKQTQINITQTWQLQGSVTAVMNSPDRETLILSSNTVSIHTKKTPKNKHVISSNNSMLHESKYMLQSENYINLLFL